MEIIGGATPIPAIAATIKVAVIAVRIVEPAVRAVAKAVVVKVAAALPAAVPRVAACTTIPIAPPFPTVAPIKRLWMPS